MSLGSGSTDDLMELLDRWTKVRAELNEKTDLVAMELVSRGVAYTEIDEVQGNRPGAAHARLKAAARTTAAKKMADSLPGTAVGDFAEEIGLKAGAVHARIRRVGEVDWWGSFTYDSASGEVTQLPFDRRGEGQLRILDKEGYLASKSKPGPKRKIALEASLAEN
jgi:hypothetical protein